MSRLGSEKLFSVASDGIAKFLVDRKARIGVNPFDLDKLFEFRQTEPCVALKDSTHSLPSFVSIHPAFCDCFNGGSRGSNYVPALRFHALLSIMNWLPHVTGKSIAVIDVIRRLHF